ncbi:MAG: ATP-binding protein [Balneolaceae bacterium]
MSVKGRLNIIVLLSVLTTLGLYGYIVKVTLDIDKELAEIEKLERFSETVSQLSLLTEYYISYGYQRDLSSWYRIINELRENVGQIEDFSRYSLISESIPQIESAFELIIRINEEPEYYPDASMREELMNRAMTRIRSDIRQVMAMSHSIATSRHENIRELQVDQRLYFLAVFVPAILLILLIAYFLRRTILISLAQLQSGTRALASGDLTKRVELSGEDEFSELGMQFNRMADELQERISKEEELIGRLETKTEDLERSNRELEQFATVVSHDLKEPLRMIGNFMGLLKKRYSGQLDEKADKYIYFATDGAARMSRMIDDLLEFSRVGRVYSEFKKADLSNIVENVLAMNAAEVEQKQARIHKDDLPVVWGVPVSLNMLFQNLIGNSLKYASKDRSPVIKIEVKEEESHWKFNLSDNGIGFDNNQSERIFELFKRLDTEEEYRGTGMGLAICKKIVEQHGGTIRAESTPGEGTRIEFTIRKMDYESKDESEDEKK